MWFSNSRRARSISIRRRSQALSTAPRHVYPEEFRGKPPGLDHFEAEKGGRPVLMAVPD